MSHDLSFGQNHLHESFEMQGKICLVTGATSGIGRATASALARLGAEVILVGRNQARTERTLKDLRSALPSPLLHGAWADFSHLEEVRRLAQDIRARFPRIDVLINNAGTVFLRRQVTPYGVESTFLVNHLAPFLLTRLLLPALEASPAARIINVSSEAHRSGTLDLADLTFARGYSGIRAYQRSKLANLLFTYELARRLEGRRIIVNAVHPGVVATRIWKVGFAPVDHLIQWIMRRIALTPEEGADTIVYLAASPEVEGVTGQYFIRRRAVPSSPASYDRELAQRLWEVSSRIVGLDVD